MVYAYCSMQRSILYKQVKMRVISVQKDDFTFVRKIVLALSFRRRADMYINVNIALLRHEVSVRYFFMPPFQKVKLPFNLNIFLSFIQLYIYAPVQLFNGISILSGTTSFTVHHLNQILMVCDFCVVSTKNTKITAFLDFKI